MAAGIYLVTCTANGTKYVGSSKNIPYRWWKHKSDLRLGRHENDRWQKTWNKYGADAFEWAVLEVVEDESNLCEREQHWIDVLHPELNAYPCADYVYMSDKQRKAHAEKVSRGQRKQWADATPEQKEQRKQALREAWARSKATRSESNKQAWSRLPRKKRTEIIQRLREQSQELAQRKLERNAERRAQKERAKQERREAREQAKAERERKKQEWEAGREERKRIQREKLRAASLAKWQDPEYRTKHQAATLAAMQDPETLKRLSESHKGRKLSKAHRRKIGEAGRGKKRSEETKRRLSDARRKWWAQRKKQK